MNNLLQVEESLASIAAHNQTLSKVIIAVLQDKRLKDHEAIEDLVNNATEVLNAYQSHPRTSNSTLEWASQVMKGMYGQSIRDLTDIDHGWHFNAHHAKAKQLESFRIEEQAEAMERLAPELWAMLDEVLRADIRRRQAKSGHGRQQDQDGDEIMQEAAGTSRSESHGGPGSEGRGVDDTNIAGASNPNSERIPRTASERRDALITIVSRVCNAVEVYLPSKF